MTVVIGGGLLVVLLSMLAELRRSRANEAVLRTRGAVAPHDPVYRTMQWAYPGGFVLMAAEGIVRHGAAPPIMTIGVLVFVVGKLLKYWAIATLGDFWTYRVFVVPGAPLVRRGPYAWLRHPNYVGVVGEFAGFALFTGAWIAGPVATVFFGYLLVRRIAAEDAALRASREL